MEEKIILSCPVTIDGKEVRELTADIDAITASGYAEASAKCVAAAGNRPTGFVPELDGTMQLYLGFAAIIAVNHKIDYNDLERIKGRDLAKIIKVGRVFFVNSGEESPADDSEKA